MKPKFALRAMALAIAATPAISFAQTSIEEIVVTASKRAESVQDVPLAITAVSGDFIKKTNVNDVKDLVRFSPGLSGNSQDSFLDTITVRGVSTNDFGNGGDASIGIYKNGNYQGRNGSAVGDLFDIERVEVLRGPQGFLFGRNAISGAISSHTVKPDLEESSGYISLNAGQRNSNTIEGAYNIPLSDTMAVRIAGFHSEEQGWVDNIHNGDKLLGHNTDAGRVSFLYMNDDVRIDSYIEYNDAESSGTVYRPRASGLEHQRLLDLAEQLGKNNPEPLRLMGRPGRNADFDAGGRKPIDDADSIRGGITIEADFNDITFTSITGYTDHNYRYLEDEDGSPLEIFLYEQDQDGSYFEQEFRLSSNNDMGFNWYAGASYYREKITSLFLGEQSEASYCIMFYEESCEDIFANYTDEELEDEFGTTVYTASTSGRIEDRNRTIGDFNGYSAYLDFGYRFNEQWNMNFGLRYSKDNKDFSQESIFNDSIFVGNVQAPNTEGEQRRTSRSWANTTWRLSTEYTPNDEELWFASITTGAKTGGFNSFILGQDGLPLAFNEEKVTSYEIGYKGTLLDGRMQLNSNLFYYVYQDLQTTYTIGDSPIVYVGNIDEQTALGLETSAQILLNDNWSLMLGGSYLKTELKGAQFICEGPGGNLVCEGQEDSETPRLTFFASLDWSLPAENGEWTANLSYSWEGKYYTDINPNLRKREQGPREAELSAGYRSEDGWSARLYVENLTDELYYDNAGTNPSNPDSNTTYAVTDLNPSRPRTVGLGVEYEF